jgi:putative flippase GtrA
MTICFFWNAVFTWEKNSNKIKTSSKLVAVKAVIAVGIAVNRSFMVFYLANHIGY